MLNKYLFPSSYYPCSSLKLKKGVGWDQRVRWQPRESIGVNRLKPITCCPYTGCFNRTSSLLSQTFYICIHYNPNFSLVGLSYFQALSHHLGYWSLICPARSMVQSWKCCSQKKKKKKKESVVLVVSVMVLMGQFKYFTLSGVKIKIICSGKMRLLMLVIRSLTLHTHVHMHTHKHKRSPTFLNVIALRQRWAP